ncbi:MAG TPA: hopanoid-associated sugar epimerase [Casimicrobiaceae bacterium]|nr:hopanoid-associated sugar epimerase [Casimicrobiaceae bacterium]
MSRPILVTGATGFIGSAVARHLLDAGHAVRALVRPDSRLDNLQALDVEIVRGDVREPDTLAPAMRGCRAVFHVAADYRLWARNPAELYATNVGGTRNVLDAVARAGVERVVYTSSVATLGTPASGDSADENTPARIEDMVGDYKRSKFMAERLALRFARRTGVEVVIVNPSAPLGTRDIKPTPTGRVIVDALRGRMPAYVDTGLNVVHVDDVAAGHLLAFERGAAGQRYVLGGENMTLAEILASVARLAGRRPPSLELPHEILLPAAYAAEGWARITGRAPALTVAGLKMSRKKMYCSSRRACDQLGYRPRPAQDAVADAVHWFEAHGYC